jgi:hypothetical protein
MLASASRCACTVLAMSLFGERATTWLHSLFTPARSVGVALR